MKEYQTELREEKVVTGIRCNGCGREIPLQGAEYFHGEKSWGYFSKQDGRRDSFDLCEDCYEKLLAGFLLPAEHREG